MRSTEGFGKARNGVGEFLQLFDPAGPDRPTAVNFFFVFSRFEYALKRAKFTKPVPRYRPDQDTAEADWVRYAQSIRLPRGMSKELAEVVKYLEDNPPLLQIVQSNGSLGWKEPERRQNQTNAGWLLFLVRTVRNNLFHGGRFPIPYIEGSDTARDDKLLRHSLTILSACLKQSPSVEGYFWESLYE